MKWWTGDGLEDWAQKEKEQGWTAVERADNLGCPQAPRPGRLGCSLGRTGSLNSLGTAQTGWASRGAGSESPGPAKGGGGAANESLKEEGAGIVPFPKVIA